MDLNKRRRADVATIRDMSYASILAVSARWGWAGSEGEAVHEATLAAARALLGPSVRTRVDAAERAFGRANREALYRDRMAPDWSGWACEERVALAATAALVGDLLPEGARGDLAVPWSQRDAGSGPRSGGR